jgi:hypothetical protein
MSFFIFYLIAKKDYYSKFVDFDKCEGKKLKIILKLDIALFYYIGKNIETFISSF